MVNPKRLRAAVLTGAICAVAWAAGAQESRPADEALDYWPHWRGPLHNGLAPNSDAPVNFGPDENVKWSYKDPGRGFSTPIIWGDRIFMTTSIGPEENRRPTSLQKLTLLCLDRATGREIWRRTAIETVPHEGYTHQLSSYANQSPMTDGERVYVFFGSRGAYCYDFDGNLIWDRDFGLRMQMFNGFGESSSPAVHGDRVVLLFDHEGDGDFIVCVDKRTGETIWRNEREEDTTWTTPLIFEHEGVTQVVTNGGQRVRSYDLATGELLWDILSNPGDHPTPMPVKAFGNIYISTGTSTGLRKFQVIDPSGRGDLTGGDALVWTTQRGVSYVPSPLVYGDELYIIRDGGNVPGNNQISILDAHTGEPHVSRQRVTDPSWELKASPVGAGDKIYMNVQQGEVLILKRGTTYEILKQNTIGELILASPVIAGGELYLRGQNTLWCFAEGAK